MARKCQTDNRFEDHTAIDPVRAFNGPGETKGSIGFDINRATVEAIARGRIRIYFWGWYEYDDVIGINRRRTEYCFELLVGIPLANGGFNLNHNYCSPHNGMDDSCFHKPKTLTEKESKEQN